jgi:hypothetical protein
MWSAIQEWSSPEGSEELFKACYGNHSCSIWSILDSQRPRVMIESILAWSKVPGSGL